jgi:hypothetical protein
VVLIRWRRVGVMCPAPPLAPGAGAGRASHASPLLLARLHPKHHHDHHHARPASFCGTLDRHDLQQRLLNPPSCTIGWSIRCMRPAGV